MSYEATGSILEIFDEQQVSEKFRKREFVIEIPDGNYPQQVKFQATQDKCDMLDNFSAGEEVKVMFNLQGKAFTKNGTTNYFNNLTAWKIESVGSGSKPAQSKTAAKAQSYTIDEDESNDLPF